jgi:hypothetical protein
VFETKSGKNTRYFETNSGIFSVFVKLDGVIPYRMVSFAGVVRLTTAVAEFEEIVWISIEENTGTTGTDVTVGVIVLCVGRGRESAVDEEEDDDDEVEGGVC